MSFYTALCCIVVCCIAVDCGGLQHCNVSLCSVLYWIALNCFVLYYSIVMARENMYIYIS